MADVPVGTQLAASALPSRKSTRLPGFDYSSPGAYFLTICLYKKRHVFGRVVDGFMQLSELGQLIHNHLLRIPQHYSNVRLDPTLIVMPSHLHAIPVILDAAAFSELADKPTAGLGPLVRSFKSGATKEARELGMIDADPLWHGRFYEHVVRHKKALERIQDYIVNNPLRWHLDRENPERLGLDDFYKWLARYSEKVRIHESSLADPASCVPTVDNRLRDDKR